VVSLFHPETAKQHETNRTEVKARDADKRKSETGSASFVSLLSFYCNVEGISEQMLAVLKKVIIFAT
ncbi:MAG: hypothetical protein K2F97_04025, partial [Muribaculaceae bacterium]|nr:hypothetical protein [Muribaculaceae bacterium]